ncbi:MAG TPA: hypothetical protein VHE53_01255 [Patescibacteria group bacterium]|nr:hypothetical protein [Patescibacteria group bacterium]
MSKECIQNCPIIQAVKGEVEHSNFLSGPMAIHPDVFSGENSGVNKILRMCEASYSCDGPRVEDVEVERGIFKIRTEIERQTVCGLPQDALPITPPRF